MNLETNELTRNGRRVDIQEQALRTISLLAQRDGELVSREELQQKLWAGDTYVDFEAGVKSVIWKARHALGDEASNPRFIETVPRQGYRFIAPVTHVTGAETAEIPAPVILPEASTRPADSAPASELQVLPEPAISPAGKRFKSSLRWIAAGLAAALVAVAGYLWNAAYPPPPSLDRMRPFATAHGQQAHPAFSPNGDILAFDWKGPGDSHSCIYVQRLEAVTPARLTQCLTSEIHPVWSNDGTQIAFLRSTGSDEFDLITVPLLGTGERRWTHIQKGATPWFDWSPDGKWFAFSEPPAAGEPPSIEVMPLATGEKRVLAVPPAGWRGDSEPAFMPDSLHVGFRRTMRPSGAEDIYVVSIGDGTTSRITFDSRTISAFTFLPGGALLFSSARAGGNRSLWWRPPAGGDLRRLTSATFDAITPAVSRNGKHFAFSKVQVDANIWRVFIDGSSAKPLIASEFNDSSPSPSPDGKRIVFESARTGTDALWTCGANGADTVRIMDSHGTPFGVARWSPDSSQIAFDWRPKGNSAIYLMAPDGGHFRALVEDKYQNGLPFFSHDGASIYFSSNRTGRTEIWRTTSAGDTPVQVTTTGGHFVQESPDGKFLYYMRDWTVWRAPVASGKLAGPETKVVDLDVGDWGDWAPANDGVYYVHRREDGAFVEFFSIAHRTVRDIYRFPKAPVFSSAGISVWPDGKSLLVVEVDQDDSSIFVQ